MRAERRARWEASEAFAKLHEAACDGDPEIVYAARVRWLGRFDREHDASVERFCATVGDVKLAAQCDALQARLFDGGGERAWSATTLYDEIARVRAGARRAVVTGTEVALGPLNPA